MKNDIFLTPEYEKLIKETLENPQKEYQIASLKINYSKPSIYHAITCAANGPDEDSLFTLLQTECVKMLDFLKSEINDPESFVKSIILEIARLGYLSNMTIEAIHEYLSDDENLDDGGGLDGSAMALRLNPPWMFVDDCENLCDDELNEKIFNDMVKTIKPEKTLEAFGFVPPSWEINIERLLDLVSAYVANVAYHEIIRSFYFQLENQATLKKLTHEINGLNDYCQRILLDISNKLGINILKIALESQEEG